MLVRPLTLAPEAMAVIAVIAVWAVIDTSETMPVTDAQQPPPSVLNCIGFPGMTSCRDAVAVLADWLPLPMS
jgi:hypothetical protein